MMKKYYLFATGLRELALKCHLKPRKTTIFFDFYNKITTFLSSDMT